MAILIQPDNTKPASCYVPILYRFERAYFRPPGPLVRGDFDIYIGGQLEATLRQPPSRITIPAGGSSIETVEFDIDVSAIVRRYLGPSAAGEHSGFASLDTFSRTPNEELVEDIQVKATYYRRTTSTNLITQESTTNADESDVLTVVAVPIQKGEDFFMTPFVGAVQPRFLTNGPSSRNVELLDASFLTCFRDEAEEIRVRIVTKTGGEYVGRTNFLSSPGARLVTWSVGPANINDATLVEISNTGSTPDTIDDNVEYYEITAGTLAGGGTWSSEIIRFNIVPPCGWKKVRLHWLNRLSGVDSFTFRHRNIKEITTNSSAAQVVEDVTIENLPSSSPLSVSTRGRFKSGIEADQFLIIEQQVTQEVKEWLMEIASSPEVYIESDGELLPVVVEDISEEAFLDTGEPDLQVVFRLQLPSYNLQTL